MKMMNKDVDRMEELLREAQNKIEEVARMVCSNQDPTAIQTWHDAARLAREVGEMIHPLYKLRNW